MTIGRGVASALFAAFLSCAILPCRSPLHAQTPLDFVAFSPDVTVDFDGTTVNPEDVAGHVHGNIVFIALGGALPPGTHVSAFAEVLPVGYLLSFNNPVLLPPGFTARPTDVIRFTFGGPTLTSAPTFSLEFDGGLLGAPPGANIDAVTVFDEDELLVSFDTAIAVDGLVVEDEDLLLLGPGPCVLLFDGSAARVPAELDLDAAHYLSSNKHLLLSFDGSGTIDGIHFDDEDVLEFNSGTSTWELNVDASMQHSSWLAADLQALYAEPLGSVTPTDTVPPTPTPTRTPTATPTSTSSPTQTPTPTSSLTPSPTFTGTSTPTPSATPTRASPTSTVSPTSGATATGTPAATSTATSTGGPTVSPSTTPSTTQTIAVSTATPTQTLEVTPTVTVAPECAGDCDGNGQVTLAELITAVNVALGRADPGVCDAADRNDDGVVTVDEIVRAVASSIEGCG